MNTLLLTLLLFTNCEVKQQENLTGDINLYICDYPSKVYGTLPLVFAETRDTILVITTYKITYTKNGISKIMKQVNPHDYRYRILDDGNIFIEGLKVKCYKHDNFRGNENSHAKVYKYISRQFWSMTNQERIEILNKYME